MNSGSAPERVVTTHGSNELADLLRYAWPSHLATLDLSRPEQPKTFSVPSDDSFRLDHDQSGTPVAPKPGQTGPEESIRRGQARSLDRAFQNAQLMTEREDLPWQRRPAPEEAESRREEC